MKRLATILMAVTLLCTVVAGSANAAIFNMWGYTNAENTFDIYNSTTKKAETTGNSGITMVSSDFDGMYGEMYFHGDFKIGDYEFHDGDELFYHIEGVELKDKAKINFLFEEEDVLITLTGQIHTYKHGDTFGSIIKIDGLQGGQYMKYTKSK